MYMGPGQHFYPAQENCMLETRQRPLIPRNDIKKKHVWDKHDGTCKYFQRFHELEFVTRAMSLDGAPPRYDPSGDREQWRLLE